MDSCGGVVIKIFNGFEFWLLGQQKMNRHRFLLRGYIVDKRHRKAEIGGAVAPGSMAITINNCTSNLICKCMPKFNWSNCVEETGLINSVCAQGTLTTSKYANAKAVLISEVDFFYESLVMPTLTSARNLVFKLLIGR